MVLFETFGNKPGSAVKIISGVVALLLIWFIDVVVAVVGDVVVVAVVAVVVVVLLAVVSVPGGFPGSGKLIFVADCGNVHAHS